MNKTALKAFINTPANSARFFLGLREATRHGIAHVQSQSGKPVIAIRYDHKKGFNYRDKKGRIIPVESIKLILREGF